MRLLRIVVVGVGIAWCASPMESQIRVAVEDGSVFGSGAGAVTQLNDDTFFNFQATLVTASGIDTPEELASYDVVVLGGSGSADADWTDAMASALLTWVQGGGGAVLTGWGNLEFDSIPSGADTDLETLFPTPNGSASNVFGYSTDPVDFATVPHVVIAGIPDFTLGDFSDDCCVELNNVAAEPDDLVLATMALFGMTDTGTAVAVKEKVGAGCSAYLGPIYLGGVATYPEVVQALRSGPADRLLEQAVAWAGSGCPIFRDGFESSNTSAWSFAVP